MLARVTVYVRVMGNEKMGNDKQGSFIKGQFRERLEPPIPVGWVLRIKELDCSADWE